jgi:hypothetical protein
MSRPVALSLPAAEPSARSSASVVGSSGPTIVMLQPVEHAHLQRDPAVRVAMVRQKCAAESFAPSIACTAAASSFPPAVNPSSDVTTSSGRSARRAAQSASRHRS